MDDCSAFAVNQTSDARCVFCIPDLGNQVSTVDFVAFPVWSLAVNEQQYFKGETKSRNLLQQVRGLVYTKVRTVYMYMYTDLMYM